jgi:hypothetical protein
MYIHSLYENFRVAMEEEGGGFLFSAFFTSLDKPKCSGRGGGRLKETVPNCCQLPHMQPKREPKKIKAAGRKPLKCAPSANPLLVLKRKITALFWAQCKTRGLKNSITQKPT